MSIKAVLFDLDGTLLSMDQDNFIKTYMGALVRFHAPRGYDPEILMKAIWKGTGAMVANDGSTSNENVFWSTFAKVFEGFDREKDEPYFDKFYKERFDDVKAVSTYDARSVDIVKHVKENGLRAILATNPLFPAIATRKRMAWAGLFEEDFEFFTSYENSNYSKPSLGYYREVLAKAGLEACECLMVGNDVSDDMVAQGLGMKVFLLTDNLINKDGVNIEKYPHGSFDELKEYIESIR